MTGDNSGFQRFRCFCVGMNTQTQSAVSLPLQFISKGSSRRSGTAAELQPDPGHVPQTFRPHQDPAQAPGDGDGGLEPRPEEDTADCRESDRGSVLHADWTGERGLRFYRRGRRHQGGKLRKYGFDSFFFFALRHLKIKIQNKLYL